MNRRTVSKLWLCTSGIVLSGMTLPVVATPVIYTDTHDDQVASKNADRDLWSASIDDDGTDLYITFNLDPGASLSTGRPSARAQAASWTRVVPPSTAVTASAR